jgi:hypothetical protein
MCMIAVASSWPLIVRSQRSTIEGSRLSMIRVRSWPSSRERSSLISGTSEPGCSGPF